MKKLYFLALFFVLTNVLDATQVRQADDVFKKWKLCQWILPDLDLRTVLFEANRARAVRSCVERNVTTFRPVAHFLEKMSAGAIGRHGFQINLELDESLDKNLQTLVVAAQEDLMSFFKMLKTYELPDLSSYSMSEQVRVYSELVSLMFAHEHGGVLQALLFSLANRLFEFCFSPATAHVFSNMTMNKPDQPVARLITGVVWKSLAGDGWKHWHEQTLERLKCDADSGKTVVYLAGGSDIYQMLTHGIYSIYVVDPQLPTQPKYYADDWEWLIKNAALTDGGLGDKIVFGEQNIVLERAIFQELEGSSIMPLDDGKSIEIQRSLTVWNVVDQKSGIVIGSVTFDRRPVVQDDFNHPADVTLLISFNELHFIAQPKCFGGSWGIEPSQFPDNLCVVVKQLAKPVDKKMINAIRTINMLNASDLKFIDLGSCVN